MLLYLVIYIIHSTMNRVCKYKLMGLPQDELFLFPLHVSDVCFRVSITKQQYLLLLITKVRSVEKGIPGKFSSESALQ